MLKFRRASKPMVMNRRRLLQAYFGCFLVKNPEPPTLRVPVYKGHPGFRFDKVINGALTANTKQFREGLEKAKASVEQLSKRMEGKS